LSASKRVANYGRCEADMRCTTWGWCGPAERAYHGHEQGVWLDRLEREYDNLRAVLDWCTDEPDRDLTAIRLEVAAGLWFFWTVRGHIREGRDRLQALLKCRHVDKSMASARARALTASGWLAWFNSDVAALETLEEALSLYREMEDDAGVARALAVKGL
jgi:non-specific serine/threonine protein kinase